MWLAQLPGESQQVPLCLRLVTLKPSVFHFITCEFKKLWKLAGAGLYFSLQNGRHEAHPYPHRGVFPPPSTTDGEPRLGVPHFSFNRQNIPDSASQNQGLWAGAPAPSCGSQELKQGFSEADWVIRCFGINRADDCTASWMSCAQWEGQSCQASDLSIHYVWKRENFEIPIGSHEKMPRKASTLPGWIQEPRSPVWIPHEGAGTIICAC